MISNDLSHENGCPGVIYCWTLLITIDDDYDQLKTNWINFSNYNYLLFCTLINLKCFSYTFTFTNLFVGPEENRTTQDGFFSLRRGVSNYLHNESNGFDNGKWH